MLITLTYCCAYLSLVIELVIFHTPSVASTKQLLKLTPITFTPGKITHRISRWSLFHKKCLLVFPCLLINVHFLLPFSYFLNIKPFFFQPLVPTSPIFNIIGCACILLGRLITFGSMLYMQNHNKQKNNEFHLHTHGIFAFTRNPGLDGMYLFFFGFLTLHPTPILLIGCFFYYYHMNFRVRIEEEFLEHRFQERYRLYTKKTPRYLLLP